MASGKKTALVIKNGRLITPLEERFTSLWVENGLILGLADRLESLLPGRDEADFTVYDAQGQFVTPGLIDLQMNGGPDCDFWADPSEKEVRALRKEQARRGVTAFLPTLITDDLGHLRKNIDFLTAQGASRKIAVGDQAASGGGEAAEGGLARMLGLHLEGPCLSPERPGVHPRKHIQPFNVAVLEQIITPSVSLVTAACEGDVDGKAIAYLKDRGVTISLGHSNATYDQAQEAFDRGATLMTHTFNALPPLHHRNTGAVGAALLREDIVCCMIADGLHLSPQACDLILRLKTSKKTVLVTDRAKIGTTGGGLVGSSISLEEAVQNISRWGLATFAQAVTMASYNAARAIGLEAEIGSLKAGMPADLAFFDAQTLEVKGSAVGGELLAFAQSDAGDKRAKQGAA